MQSISNLLFGPSEAQQERARDDQVNDMVQKVTHNVEAMEKKRDLLASRATRLKKEATTAQREGHLEMAESKASEWNDTMDQLSQINSLLENQRSTRTATDQMSTNVNAFETQKSAAHALEHMTSQIKASDVDDVSLRLETQLDQVEDVSRILTKPLVRRPVQKRSAAANKIRNPRADRAKDLLAQWDTDSMPVTTPTSISVTNVNPTPAAATVESSKTTTTTTTAKSEQKEDEIYK